MERRRTSYVFPLSLKKKGEEEESASLDLLCFPLFVEEKNGGERRSDVGMKIRKRATSDFGGLFPEGEPYISMTRTVRSDGPDQTSHIFGENCSHQIISLL